MGLPNVRPIIVRYYQPSEHGSITESEFTFEPKWNGSRGMLFIDGEEAYFKGKENQFRYRLADFAKQLRERLHVRSLILDGEILRKDRIYSYVVFDLLFINGRSLISKPLYERRSRLEALAESRPAIRLITQYISARLAERKSQELNWEGIVAKRKTSIYTASADWFKFPNPNYDPKRKA